MKEIPLTQGKVALVDDSDFETLSKLKWACSNNGNKNVDKFYASRRSLVGGKKITFYMHRVIMGHPELDIDHIDGNCLNNQRSNLRICTRSQNMMNQSKAHRWDHFKGVNWHKKAKKWRAYIKKDRKSIHLGHFDFSVDAAIAYNEAATRLFGEFASLNQIPN